MSDITWFTHIACPAFGTVLCVIMWFSSLSSILRVRQDKNLGSLNPIPYGIAALNCIAWVLYSILLHDYYIFFANLFGVALAFFYAITGLVLLHKRGDHADMITFNRLEFILVGGILFYTALGLVIGIILSSPDDMGTNKTIVGTCAITFLLMYYAAPCSTLYHVIATRDSSSLHAPMLVANLANGAMWTIYGIAAMNDPIVYGSNGFGVVFSIFQLTLKALFYKATATAPHGRSAESIKNDIQATEMVSPIV
jgi:solute carrier family 50 (sugar transporter)